jgi:hypothetical protein
MPTLYSAAALAVAATYCVWRAWDQARLQRERLVGQRVAYMLWVMVGVEDDAALS